MQVATEAGRVVCPNCGVAETPLTRLRGLLGRRSLAPEEGLLLRPSPSIHTWFMRFSIDAVFLDRELRVLKIVESLRPWRFAGCRGAHAVLELAAGAVSRSGLTVGERLELADPEPPT